MQRAVCSVQCDVCSEQISVCNVQCEVYILSAVLIFQCAVSVSAYFSRQCSVQGVGLKFSVKFALWCSQINSVYFSAINSSAMWSFYVCVILQ